LYEKAFRGEIREFTGVSAPYEAPEQAEVVVDTRVLSINEAAEKVLKVVSYENFRKIK
jgi:adenylylsulfate kinase-like enzyme